MATFAGRPGSAAILFDFDGTLSPIVDDPLDARPLDGAVDLLASLAEAYQVVGILSGRPVSFLAPLMPRGVVISGLYGLEVIRDGVRVDHPNCGHGARSVADVAGVLGSRTGRHGRRVQGPVADASTTAPAPTWPARCSRGPSARPPARAAVPAGPHVGRAAPADRGRQGHGGRGGGRRLAPVCFVGDDAGDLPAYDALDRWPPRAGTRSRWRWPATRPARTGPAGRRRARRPARRPRPARGLLAHAHR